MTRFSGASLTLGLKKEVDQGFGVAHGTCPPAGEVLYVFFHRFVAQEGKGILLSGCKTRGPATTEQPVAPPEPSRC